MSAPMLSPGAAFRIAYLPAHWIVHAAHRTIFEAAAQRVPALLQKANDERAWLDARRNWLPVLEARLREAAQSGDITLPALPPLTSPAPFTIWLRHLPEFVRPRLTTEALQVAWDVGEKARAVAVDVMMAEYIARLRCTAPNDFDLRTQAQQLAKLLPEAAGAMARALDAMQHPIVGLYAGEVPSLVRSTSELEPTTPGGYEHLAGLTARVIACIECYADQLDASHEDERGRYIPQILESMARSEAQAKDLAKGQTITLGRFTKGARQVIARAQGLADQRGHLNLTSLHVLTALLALPPVKEKIAAAGGDLQAAEAAAEVALAAQPTSKEPSYLSSELIELFGELEKASREVTLEDVLFACVNLPARETLEDIDRNGVDAPGEALRRPVVSAGHLERVARR